MSQISKAFGILQPGCYWTSSKHEKVTSAVKRSCFTVRKDFAY